MSWSPYVRTKTYQHRQLTNQQVLNIINKELSGIFESMIRQALHIELMRENDINYVRDLSNNRYKVSGRTFENEYPNIGRPQLEFKVHFDDENESYHFIITSYEL